MAMGNGEGSLLPELLHEVRELRTDLQAHVESSATFFESLTSLFQTYVRETKERFARMDQNLSRMARMITVVADQRDDHEARLRRLEGR